jgi:hypothetical protein
MLFADPAKVAHKAGQRRRESAVHTNGRIAKTAVARTRPLVLSDLARKAVTARWKKATPEQRAATVAGLNAARAAKRRTRTSK